MDNKTKLTVIKGVADLGANVAGNRDRLVALATWAKANMAFDSDYKVPREIRADFNKGALITFANLPTRKPVTFRKSEDGIYREVPKGSKPTESDYTLSVGAALAYSGHEMAQMKSADVEKWRMVYKLRNDASTYHASAWAALIGAVRKLDPAKSARGANATWSEAASKMLDSLIKRAKTARTKGLEAPDEAKLVKAIAAFNLALK